MVKYSTLLQSFVYYVAIDIIASTYVDLIENRPRIRLATDETACVALRVPVSICDIPLHVAYSTAFRSDGFL